MGKHRKNPNRPEPDYAVGYRKPPAEHQFRPGEVRAGRRPRKKAKTITEEMAELLAETVTVTDQQGVRRRVSRQTVVLRAIYAKAMKGDLKAVEFCLRHAAGVNSDPGNDEPELFTADDREMLTDYLRRTEPDEHDREDRAASSSSSSPSGDDDDAD